MVGGIGTFGVVYDYSNRFEKAGVRAVVVRAGKFKGVTTPGTNITPEQIAELQSVIDGLNDLFVGAVARGRRMSNERATALADGKVYLGQHAVEVGMADTVVNFDDAVAGLRAEAGRGW